MDGPWAETCSRLKSSVGAPDCDTKHCGCPKTAWRDKASCQVQILLHVALPLESDPGPTLGKPHVRQHH
eukprot:2065338-Alexandrium_andersonii.AAC.1